MKISTEIGSAAKIVGEAKAIEYIAKAGFDAWDFSMFGMYKCFRPTRTIFAGTHPLGRKNYLGFAKELKNISDYYGLECNQAHAPFPSVWNACEKYMKRSLECCAAIGAKICVIHPDNNKSAEANAEMYLSLLPTAKEYGVKIASENMWNWSSKLGHSTPAACSSPEDFNAHLDAVNDDWLVACLDIGHAEMLGSGTSAVEMIEKLGKRLKALHIHDNDKLNDSHQIPFSMNIDFEKVVTALRNAGYDGYFTLEADRYLKGRSPSDVYDGICELSRAARRLSAMFDGI